MAEVNDIVPVPKEIAETGFVRIVGNATRARPNPLSVYGKWDYLAIEHDPVKRQDKGSAFAMKESEVTKYAE